MRAILCLVVVSLAFVYGANPDNIVIVPVERVPNIIKASEKCVEQMKLEKEIMQKFFAWELSDSDTTRKYMHCFGNESGYIANDGSIVKNQVLDVVGSHRNRVDGIIDDCNQLKNEDKYESVYRVIMCFREKSKLQFKV